MSEFKNVTVARKANQYFGGRVTSRTLQFADGTHKTLGMMVPGSYEFSTSQAELMEITEGQLEYTLQDSPEAITVQGGESFNVPANTTFKVNASTMVDYCCSYLEP